MIIMIKGSLTVDYIGTWIRYIHRYIAPLCNKIGWFSSVPDEAEAEAEEKLTGLELRIST